MPDLSLRELQEQQRWVDSYSVDFHANPQSHKHVTHALLHIGKALGRLFGFVEAQDHRDPARSAGEPVVASMLADIVICAIRVANVWPVKIDLYAAVLRRLAEKSGG